MKSTSVLLVLCSSLASLANAQIKWTNATEADWKPFTFLFDDAAVLTCDVGNTEYWSNICNRSAYWEFWSWNVTYGVIPKKLIHTVHLNHCRFKPTCEIGCVAACKCTLQGSGLPCDGGVNDALTGYNPSSTTDETPASDNAQTPPAASGASAIPPPPAGGDSAIPPPPAGSSDSAVPPPPAGGSDSAVPPPPAGGSDSAIPPPPAGGSDSAIPPPPAGGSDSAVPPPPAGGSDSAVPPPPAGGSDSAIPPPPGASNPSKPPPGSAIPKPPPAGGVAVKSVEEEDTTSFELCQQDSGVITCTGTGGDFGLCDFNHDDFDSWTIDTATVGGFNLNLVGCKSPPCDVSCALDTCTCTNPDTGAACGGCTAPSSSKGVLSVVSEPKGTTAFFAFQDAKIQCPAGAACEYDPINFNDVTAENQDQTEDGNFGEIEFVSSGSASFIDCQAMNCEIVCSSVCTCMQGEGSPLMCATMDSIQRGTAEKFEITAGGPPAPSAAEGSKYWSSFLSLLSAVCVMYFAV